MKRIVLYNCSRLIARAEAETPTGIDRVDLRYLDYFIHDPETELYGVAVERKTVRLYGGTSLRRINDLLVRRWMHAGRFTAADMRLLKFHKLRVKMTDAVAPLRHKLAGAGVSSRLRESLSRHADLPVFYVNCSHHGMRHRNRAMFGLLKAETGAREIFYVHDMIPLDFPEFSKAGDPERHVERMTIVARNADMVIANSRYSADRFLDFAHAKGFAPPEPDVLHIGVEPTFADALAHATPQPTSEQPYFVTIGTIEPRKNHKVLLDAWQSMIDHGGPVPQLRIIGRRGWTTEANADYDTRVARLFPHVIETGPIPDIDMISNLLGARALLFPSFTEGWGMPLVEALVAGTPAIVSDIPAFAEASQDLVPRLDPRDPEAWRNMILRFADPADPARDEALKRIRGFVVPTWEAQFAALESALARRFGAQAI